MRQFIKFVFASSVGFFLAFFIAGFIVFAYIFTLVSQFQKEFEKGFVDREKVEVKDNSIVKLELDYPIHERTGPSPFRMNFRNFEADKRLGLNDILDAIEHAKSDDKVKGLYLELDRYMGSGAASEAIRQQLKDFQQSDKFIKAYAETWTESAYYMASVADKIYLHPNGFFEFNGMGIQTTFLNKTLEKKLKIRPQVFKIGKYKSAGEVFSRQDMSEPNKQQLSQLLNSIYDHYLANIAASRVPSASQLEEISDSLKVRTPEDAKEHQLVDDLYYHDEIRSTLKAEVGMEEKESLNIIKIGKYYKSRVEHPTAEEKIAVIYASGTIVPGESDESENISSDRMSEAIKKAREDTTVEAIVLRVNSPGGSALASDIIWRETVLAQKEKPLIVSMSDVAASGGYYISCAADTIVAHPNTITGSIGVLGVFMNAQQFFNDKLGITFDEVGTGAYTNFASPTRPLKEEEEKIIQQTINRIYKQFVERVAEGREASYDSIHQIGQGRVWSGIDAKRIGLVDVLGGREKAIAIAAQKAGLEEYELVQYPEKKSPWKKLVEQFSSGVIARILPVDLQSSTSFKKYEQAKETLEADGFQARMPYLLELKY